MDEYRIINEDENTIYVQYLVPYEKSRSFFVNIARNITLIKNVKFIFVYGPLNFLFIKKEEL